MGGGEAHRLHMCNTASKTDDKVNTKGPAGEQNEIGTQTGNEVKKNRSVAGVLFFAWCLAGVVARPYVMQARR